MERENKMMDFIKEEDFKDPRPDDKVTGDPGEVSTERETDQEASTEAPEQHVDDDSKGREDYVEDRESIGAKLGKAIEKAVVPRPVPTREADAAFLNVDDLAARLNDFVRFIASEGIKVVIQPASNFHVWKHTLGTAPQLIAGLQPNRQSITLRVASADTIYISDENGTCNADSGYQLTGETLTIEANTEIWAVGAVGDEIVSVKGEYYQ